MCVWNGIIEIPWTYSIHRNIISSVVCTVQEVFLNKFIAVCGMQIGIMAVKNVCHLDSHSEQDFHPLDQ